MVNRPSQPEITTVNSEELQTVIRDLLPSQAGFGSDLMATNVIQPIIDLTPAAEGSALSNDLARAIAFGSQTAFETAGTVAAIASSAGFYRVIGTATQLDSTGSHAIGFSMTDGSATKQVWAIVGPGKNANVVSVPFDLIFWVVPGVTLQVFSDSAQGFMAGSIRQVADSLGSTVNPSGFPL